MTPTRIAGNSFDRRNARLIHQTARIYSYARHIRQLATDAAAPSTPAPLAEAATLDTWREFPRATLRRP